MRVQLLQSSLRRKPSWQTPHSVSSQLRQFLMLQVAASQAMALELSLKPTPHTSQTVELKQSTQREMLQASSMQMLVLFASGVNPSAQVVQAMADEQTMHSGSTATPQSRQVLVQLLKQQVVQMVEQLEAASDEQVTHSCQGAQQTWLPRQKGVVGDTEQDVLALPLVEEELVVELLPPSVQTQPASMQTSSSLQLQFWPRAAASSRQAKITLTSILVDIYVLSIESPINLPHKTQYEDLFCKKGHYRQAFSGRALWTMPREATFPFRFVTPYWFY